MGLGDILANCQRLPDREIAIAQYRHPSGRRIRMDPCFALGPIERDHNFLKVDIEMTKRDARAHRPRRVVLVADNQG